MSLVNFNNNTLNNPSINRITETKENFNYPEKANILINFIKYPNTKYMKSTNFIYGSYSLKTQPYYSDIDTINNVNINLYRNESIPYIIEYFKKIVLKIIKKKDWFLTDIKAGIYENSNEPVHWTPKEILNNRRNGYIPDFNDNFGQKSLKDAFTDNSLIKVDMVAPYYGRYIEVTVVYFFTDLDGPINYKSFQLEPQYILKSLKEDTIKQFNNHKYFKTAKRIFAQAKAKKDIKVLKAIEPLINSNVSKLSSIESDLKTIILLLEENKPISKRVINTEFNNIVDKLSVIINISFNDKSLIQMLNYAGYAIKENDNKQAIKALTIIVNYLHHITNIQTIDYITKNNLVNILNSYIN